MHVPSSMANNVTSSASVVFFAAVPANYAVTGTLLTSDTFENSDRQQNCPIGCEIPFIVYNVFTRAITSDGIVEYAIFKVERASSVPTTDNVLLPDNTTISTQGLQAAMRQYQPGRVLKYGALAVAAEQPRQISLGMSYSKFKMAKMRTGDYYGIILFNRNGAGVTLDIQARYNAKI